MTANFYALIEARRPDNLDTPLLETDGGVPWSYRKIGDLAGRMAWALASAGAMRGDRVAAQVEKSPEALALYLACLRSGLTFLPLNTAYQPAEIEYFLGDAAPAVFVCRPDAEATWSAVARSTGLHSILTLDAAGGGSLMHAAADRDPHFPTAEANAEDLAVLIYTSGTTGRSKGAMITHGNLAANGEALVDAWGFNGTDVLLHALPMFHIHGLFVATHCVLLSGARMLFHARFDAREVLRDLPRATVLMGVPTFYTRLLAQQDLSPETAANVRLFVSGSAPLQLETFTSFEERTAKRILERYGMSEAGIITSNPLDGERRGGTVGRPLRDVEVRVADADDRPLAHGAVGDVQIRGPSVFKGYWNMPEKTRDEFTTDGWFRTGDVGCFDADGYLSIVGRAKDLIITGGYNVYPKEIERELDALPGVIESAVIGVPHPDFGEAVTAIVVASPTARPDEASLLAALRARLAGYKVPKRVVVVDDLPRNAMGKVQKNLLRELYGR